MQIVIWADAEKIDLLIAKNASIEWKIVEEEASFNIEEADIYLNLNDDAYSMDYSNITKPVLINSVAFTLKEINAGKNIVRINGWSSFLENNTWEVSGKIDAVSAEFFILMDKKIINCADEPGFISALIIATIINEAYYAKNDQVSNEADIDTAMKLGTNYPYGPFEWASVIGLKNIYQLLLKLAEKDKRYLPAHGLFA
ncbi:MAG: 3-hydroxyacyl-CoA dehydrogenase family protein [Ferruginibacter sp.]